MALDKRTHRYKALPRATKLYVAEGTGYRSDCELALKRAETSGTDSLAAREDRWGRPLHAMHGLVRRPTWGAGKDNWP
jgi:hypothetical protein